MGLRKEIHYEISNLIYSVDGYMDPAKILSPEQRKYLINNCDSRGEFNLQETPWNEGGKTGKIEKIVFENSQHELEWLHYLEWVKLGRPQEIRVKKKYLKEK